MLFSADVCMIKTDFSFAVPTYGVDLVRNRLVPRDPPPDAGKPHLVLDSDGKEWTHWPGISRRRMENLSDHSGLFYDFADLEPNGLAVRGFADRYGTIGYASQDTNLEPRPVHAFSKYQDFQSFSWEKDEFSNVDKWFPEIEKMKQSVSVWESGKFPGPLMGGYITYLARGTLTNRSNNEGEIDLVFEPDRLLDALYMQFYEVMARNAVFRRCEWAGCGRRFEVGPGSGKRVDARFCRPKCRDDFHNSHRS